MTTAQAVPGSFRSMLHHSIEVTFRSRCKVEDRNTGLTLDICRTEKECNGTGNVDENDIVNADMTVYLYYTNDQDYSKIKGERT